MRCQDPDEAALKALCVEFEFNSIGRRLFGDEFKAGRGGAASGSDSKAPSAEPAAAEPAEPEAALETVADRGAEYVCVRTADERAALIKKLKQQSIICFDSETTGLDPKTAKIIGLAFAFEKGKGLLRSGDFL